MLKIDIFCRVIDNYGDIGVCWRLARQLVTEHDCDVRLFVDDLSAFRVIAPGINVTEAEQTLLGVAVLMWAAAEQLAPRDVVIEAFACDPPDTYVESMALRAIKPVWINLEYLSAETWVDAVHCMPSQHPRLPLTKYFFCPGFTEASGGLIRERDSSSLDSLPLKGGERVRIFAFAYPDAPLLALAHGFADAGLRINVTLAAPLAQADPAWQRAPTVAQSKFDSLLAEFDFLIVRGEDSFVRAQWAAKPLLWHIYPTNDQAHIVKLDAWLDRYCVGLEASTAAAYRVASHGFNRAPGKATSREAYALLAHHLNELAAHAVLWRDALMQQTDLAARLLKFVAAHRP